MAIRQNPRSRAARESAEEAAARFIDEREDASEPPAAAPAPAANGSGKKVVVMKLDAGLVDEIDQAARINGVSRTAWASMKLRDALRRDKDGR